jgi:hypothetical protein
MEQVIIDITFKDHSSSIRTTDKEEAFIILEEWLDEDIKHITVSGEVFEKIQIDYIVFR